MSFVQSLMCFAVCTFLGVCILIFLFFVSAFCIAELLILCFLFLCLSTMPLRLRASDLDVRLLFVCLCLSTYLHLGLSPFYPLYLCLCSSLCFCLFVYVCVSLYLGLCSCIVCIGTYAACLSVCLPLSMPGLCVCIYVRMCVCACVCMGLSTCLYLCLCSYHLPFVSEPVPIGGDCISIVTYLPGMMSFIGCNQTQFAFESKQVSSHHPSALPMVGRKQGVVPFTPGPEVIKRLH